jgi:hypothetical protein
LADIKAVVERPEIWSVSINGNKVDLSVMGLKAMPGQGMVMVGEKMSLITGKTLE